MLNTKCLFISYPTEQFKAYKQAMIKHAQAKDDYEVDIIHVKNVCIPVQVPHRFSKRLTGSIQTKRTV